MQSRAAPGKVAICFSIATATPDEAVTVHKIAAQIRPLRPVKGTSTIHQAVLHIAARIVIDPVLNPLGHVPQQVVQAPRVWFLLPDRVRSPPIFPGYQEIRGRRGQSRFPLWLWERTRYPGASVTDPRSQRWA